MLVDIENFGAVAVDPANATIRALSDKGIRLGHVCVAVPHPVSRTAVMLKNGSIPFLDAPFDEALWKALGCFICVDEKHCMWINVAAIASLSLVEGERRSRGYQTCIKFQGGPGVFDTKIAPEAILMAIAQINPHSADQLRAALEQSAPKAGKRSFHDLPLHARRPHTTEGKNTISDLAAAQRGTKPDPQP